MSEDSKVNIPGNLIVDGALQGFRIEKERMSVGKSDVLQIDSLEDLVGPTSKPFDVPGQLLVNGVPVDNEMRPLQTLTARIGPVETWGGKVQPPVAVQAPELTKPIGAIPAKELQAMIDEDVRGGKTWPRVTPSDIDHAIQSKFFFTAAEGIEGASKGGMRPAGSAEHLKRVTLCTLVLRNGWVVIGVSGATDPKNFSQEIGEKAAFENAKSQMWPLLGYALRTRLHDARRDFEDLV